MHCTLLVPDLLPSVPEATIFRDLHVPALVRLLARGQCTSLDAPGVEAWLCRDFAIDRQRDWPVAPLALMGDGGDPGDAYWLRSDPVHLRAQRSQLVLVPASAIAPTADEAHALISSLNTHFSQDGLVFQAPHPERWYLRLPHAPALNTHTLDEAAGKDIDSRLPGGEEGLAWHRRLNEIQMLLHAHPVNEAREALNQPAINSVWLWGGGVKPESHPRRYARIWSDDALVRGLAAASDATCDTLPGSAESLLTAIAGTKGHHLALLPQLRTAVGSGDFEQWRNQLMALERDWFAPLHHALRRRRLSTLTIVAPGATRTVRCDITRADLWKLWRPTRSLEHYG